MRGFDSLFFVVLLSLVFGSFLELLSVSVGRGSFDREKRSGIECGIDAMGDSRDPIDVSIYLVGMVILILDIEAVIIYPYVRSVEVVSSLGVYGMGEIMLELLLGLVYIFRFGVVELEDEK